MRKVFRLLLAILICQLAGILGAVATVPSISSWYIYLNKPFFTPPAFIFGPVWTLLYILMGISLFLVWETKKKREECLCCFWVQLALNALWSLIFFGAKNLAFSFIIIIFLWLSILATILQFRKISKIAAWMLVPYLIWVSFASLLNLAVVLLNQ